MGGLDVLAKIMSLKGAKQSMEESAINQQLRVINALDLIKDREERRKEQERSNLIALQQQQQKQQEDQIKYVVNKHTDLYFKAQGNEALQKNLLDVMNQNKGSLPPAYQAVIEPYIRTGPFSQTEMLRKKYREITPPPPDLPNDILLGNSANLPYKIAENEFSKLDWKAGETEFLTKRKQERKSLISLGEGMVALRDKDGVVNVTSEANLRLSAKAKEYGATSLGQVIADGGKVYSPHKGIAIVDGEQVQVQNYVNAFDNKVGVEPVYQKGQPPEPFNNPLLADLMIGYAAKDPDELTRSKGSRLSQQIKAMREDGKSSKTIIDNVLKPQFPGINFRFIKPSGDDFVTAPDRYTSGWLSWDDDPSDELMRAFPGTYTPVGKDSKGEIGIYYDKVSDAAYDNDGIYLGNLQQVLKAIGGK